MTIKTKTGFYVPVLRDEPELSAPPEPTDRGLDWVTFWVMAIAAISAVGFLGLAFGWFKSPEQSLLDQNQKLQAQIAAQNAQIEAQLDKQAQLNQCFQEFIK